MAPLSTAKKLAPVLFACALYAAFSSIHLFDPPIGTHGWRQCIAASEARLYAEGQPFLYPRAEGCGAEPNTFMASEFPLYPWVMGKLGGAGGINFVGRALGILSAWVLMFALYAIGRWLFERMRFGELAALTGACFIAVSPLYRFYGISFVPDIHAHALALLGVALFTGRLRPRDEPPPKLGAVAFAAGTLLLALAGLTKLLALPHLTLAGLVLLDRARADETLKAVLKPKPILYGLGMAVVVLAACWLWYRHWVPVLKRGGCELVWLPDVPDDSYKTMTFTDPEWRARMSKWGREDLLGPLWPLALAGLLLAPFLVGRGFALPLWYLGCAATFVRLGWHTKQHDYDLLVMLPEYALGVGASVALLVRGLARVVKVDALPARLRPALPFLGLAAGMAALSPGAHQQSRRHVYSPPGEVETQSALDKVLPQGEPIHYFGGKNDPRVPYFAARKAWGTELWFYCQQKDVKYDCALLVESKGNLAPCIERRAAVAWSSRALVCGIMQPGTPLVPERVLTTVAASIDAPADVSWPGVGRFLGADFLNVRDVVTRAHHDVVDLYVIPERDGVPLELLVDGKPAKLDVEPARWLAGTLIVSRAQLPRPDAAVVVKTPSGEVPLRRTR